MEIKNLFTPQAQQGLSGAYNTIKRKVKPLTDIGQQIGGEIKQKYNPAVSQVSETIGNISEPIVKPIQEAKQITQAIGEINTFFSDAKITIDDIKALAEDEGVDFNEVLTKFKNNGIKVKGMEEEVAKQQQEVKVQDEQPTDFSGRGLAINPEYDQVDILGKTTANIPKWKSQPDEGFGMKALKTAVNLTPNAVQVGAGIGDIGLSYLRNLDQGPIDAFTETAKAKIINPTYQQALGVADIAKRGYTAGEEGKLRLVEGGKEINAPGWVKGTAGAMDALLKKGTEFVVENPVATIGMMQGAKNIPRGMQALKTAGLETMKGNIGTATKGIVKSTGVGLKENIYEPIKMGVTAPFIVGKAGTKLIGKGISKGLEKSGVKSPLSSNNVTARTEGGTEFTVDQTPTLGKNITDKLFNKDNEILAQQSVFPKATKEKTPQARLDSAKIALQGVKQLYEDKANGVVKSDINNMGGGVEGISEGLDYHGSQIGKLTKNDAVVDTADLTPKLEEVISRPFASLNPDMHSLVTKVADAFNQSGNKVNIETLQGALSNIKSEIFGNGANIAKLYKTESGKALNDFLKNLEERFQNTIEETSGNSAELAKAKKAYSNYKKIEKDLTDSYMVELRNQGKGLTGTVGKVAGLYEVLSNPSISGILKAVALKQAGETMQYYKSRSGNWETLIRNLDREAVQRNLIPNISKNDSVNTKPSSSNMDNSKFGVKPKSKPEEQKLLPAPKLPRGTSFPKPIVKRSADVESGLIAEAKKYKSAEDFAENYIPKTISLYKKSPFTGEGKYADAKIIRRENNITAYQGGEDVGRNRQHWTLNKKYAEKFGNVIEKKGDFYQVDNGNRMVDVYVEAPSKDQLRKIYEQANSPKPIVKNLQKTEKSDMETKKLIEPIKGVNFTRLKGLIEDIKSNNGGQKGVLGDFLEGNEMKKIYGDALDTPVYIFDESHPVFKTAENINKEGTPRAMTAFIEGGKLSNKGTPIIAIRGKISVDGLIKTLTEEGIHALQKLKGRKRIGSATAKNFSEYEGNANEINANKGASYAMKIINRK